MRAVTGAQLVDQHGGVAEDHRQDVVEVVRDAAREPRHRLQLLRFHQPRFDALAFPHLALQILFRCFQAALARQRLGERLAQREAEAIEDHRQDGEDDHRQPELPERLRRRGVWTGAAQHLVVAGEAGGHGDEEREEQCPERAPSEQERGQREQDGEVLEGVAAELEAAVDHDPGVQRGKAEHEDEHARLVASAPQRPEGQPEQHDLAKVHQRRRGRAEGLALGEADGLDEDQRDGEDGRQDLQRERVAALKKIIDRKRFEPIAPAAKDSAHQRHHRVELTLSSTRVSTRDQSRSCRRGRRACSACSSCARSPASRRLSRPPRW